MSEKSIIISGFFGIILLSSVLMYQMLNKDIARENKIFNQQNQINNSQFNEKPKIEIETRR